MPDFRGLFLRGIGGNSAGLGVQQGDAIRNITGWMGELKGGWAGGAFATIAEYEGNIAGARHFGTGNVGFDASRVVPTADENRPINKAVRYFIRAAM